MLAVEVVSGSLPRQPLACAIVEHDDRHVVGAMAIQIRALTPNDAFHISLQFHIERGLNTNGSCRCHSDSTISTKCGAANDGVSVGQRRAAPRVLRLLFERTTSRSVAIRSMT